MNPRSEGPNDDALNEWLLSTAYAGQTVTATASDKRPWFATRLNLEWTDELRARADAAGIRLFRADPAAAESWNPGWGEGNAFVGSRNDPAQVVLELPARNRHDAYARVIEALGVGFDAFAVMPGECPTARPS